MTAETYDRFLLALCIWREARGCDDAARAGVKHVVLNRARQSNERVASVILKPWQFSSFNPKDPNAVKFPMPEEKAWLECCALADSDEPDPTGGATHYHSPMPTPPKWAVPEKLTAHIGPFRFYQG